MASTQIADGGDALPVELRVASALAAARAAGTSAAALDALGDTIGWRDELAARSLGPRDHTALRREIAAASRALAELGLSAQPSSPRHPGDALVELRTACEWIELLALAGEALPELHAWVSPWLARTERLVALALPVLGELPLLDMVDRGHPLNHTCRTIADMLPHLAAPCAALWASWAGATRRHPVVRDALALRDRVREHGWRYAQLVDHARDLAERSGVPTAAILDWILGAAPPPLGPSDARERLDGRTGYAHSDPDIVVTALALLDIGPGDRFYDLGSGLGLPCLIAALSGSATYRGIEFHADRVERARTNARRLGVAGVEFFVGDVSRFDWSDGTRFYMFNPFPDDVLRVIAGRLRRVAGHHAIRIACFHNLLPDGFTRITGDGPLAVYEAAPRPARTATPGL